MHDPDVTEEERIQAIQDAKSTEDGKMQYKEINAVEVFYENPC